MGMFPGQVEKIVLSLEQMRVLGSVIRTEVFYSFNHLEPRSVAEVAAGIGKSASTVHYHTNVLIEAGLLIDVEERKSYARTEKLYVHVGLDTYSMRPGRATEEYRQEVVNGFYAITRSLGREMDEAYQATGVDTVYDAFITYQQSRIRVSKEKAAEIRVMMQDFRKSLLNLHDPDGEYRIRAAVYLAPSIESSRKVTGGKKRPKEVEIEDD